MKPLSRWETGCVLLVSFLLIGTVSLVVISNHTVARETRVPLPRLQDTGTMTADTFLAHVKTVSDTLTGRPGFAHVGINTDTDLHLLSNTVDGVGFLEFSDFASDGNFHGFAEFGNGDLRHTFNGNASGALDITDTGVAQIQFSDFNNDSNRHGWGENGLDQLAHLYQGNVTEFRIHPTGKVETTQVELENTASSDSEAMRAGDYDSDLDQQVEDADNVTGTYKGNDIDSNGDGTVDSSDALTVGAASGQFNDESDSHGDEAAEESSIANGDTNVISVTFSDTYAAASGGVGSPAGTDAEAGVYCQFGGWVRNANGDINGMDIVKYNNSGASSNIVCEWNVAGIIQ